MLADDQVTFRFRMEVVGEAVTSRFQRADSDCYRSAAGNHFLDAQHITFEFRRNGIDIFERDRDRLAGWRMRLGRLKAMILKRNLYAHRVLGPRRRVEY